MVLAAKEVDVEVILVEVESQIIAALLAVQIAAKGAGLLRDGRSPAPGGLQILYLFPSHTGSWTLRKMARFFNPALHLVGLGTGFEVHHISQYSCKVRTFLAAVDVFASLSI